MAKSDLVVIPLGIEQVEAGGIAIQRVPGSYLNTVLACQTVNCPDNDLGLTEPGQAVMVKARDCYKGRREGVGVWFVRQDAVLGIATGVADGPR